MLKEEEKALIRAEEIYRLEVRRELEASKPHPSRRAQLWLFLNSSIALWFLSSVVLAGLTALFTANQRSHAEQLRKAEIVRHLDTEISNRKAMALIGSRVAIMNIEHGLSYMYSPQAIYNFAVSYMDNFFITDPKNPRDWSSYPEYRNRSFRSLISELKTFVGSGVLPELNKALAAYDKLSVFASDYSKEAMTPNKQKNLNAVKNSIEILDREIVWKSGM